MPHAVAQGTGGRSSQSGKTMAVFGATGFLGMYVVDTLGERGHNIVVATRGDDMSWRSLKTCADLGKMAPSYIDHRDENSIRDTVRDCDVVINLMGKHYDTKHFFPTLINCSVREVNVNVAEMVARISREENVKHLVHISAASASLDARSEWARTKAEGEIKVKEQFPGAVIVRPNMIYGEEDRLLSLWAQFVKVASHIPLMEGGAAKLNPVFVGDVGDAVAGIAENYSTVDSTFNLSGHHDYTVKEIFEYIMETIDLEKPFVDVPVPAMEFLGKIVNNLPNPYLTPDNVQLLLQDWQGPGAGEKSWDDLGMDKISNFETKAYDHLFRYKRGGHFADKDSAKSVLYRYGKQIMK